MRHKFWPALSVLLALACVFLWQRGETPYQVDDLWLHGMLHARARFLDYLNYGDEGDYWYGAAEFQTMVNAAKLENLNGQIDANAVMGVLVYESEQAKPYLVELCGALETCIADPDNTAQWEISMNELRHLLEEGA